MLISVASILTKGPLNNFFSYQIRNKIGHTYVLIKGPPIVHKSEIRIKKRIEKVKMNGASILTKGPHNGFQFFIIIFFKQYRKKK